VRVNSANFPPPSNPLPLEGRGIPFKGSTGLFKKWFREVSPHRSRSPQRAQRAPAPTKGGLGEKVKILSFLPPGRR